MLDALRSLMAPPALVVLGGVVGAVAAFARLFRRRTADHTRETHPDPFDAFLRSLDDDPGDSDGRGR